MAQTSQALLKPACMPIVAYSVFQQAQQASFTSSTIIKFTKVQLLQVINKPPVGLFTCVPCSTAECKKNSHCGGASG